MLYYRFDICKDYNGRYERISVGGITTDRGQRWEFSVGGVPTGKQINEYIPPNGVTVLFTLVTIFENQGRLLNIFHEVSYGGPQITSRFSRLL